MCQIPALEVFGFIGMGGILDHYPVMEQGRHGGIDDVTFIRRDDDLLGRKIIKTTPHNQMTQQLSWRLIAQEKICFPPVFNEARIGVTARYMLNESKRLVQAQFLFVEKQI